MNLLSIDNTYVDLSEACANEPLAHLLLAIKEMPDEASPAVWVYPFDEYCDCKTENEIRDVFFGNWLIRGAINNGAPISTVVSTKNFVGHDKSLYKNSILITPVPSPDSEFEEKILAFACDGGKVVFYGNTARASRRFLELFGISHSSPICGELELTVDGESRGIIKHEELVCAGGVSELSERAYASLGERAYAALVQNAIWLRGSVSAKYTKGRSLLQVHEREKYFIGESLLLDAISRLGYEIVFEKDKTTVPPVFTLHRCNGAFIFSSFHPSTTVKTKLRFPLGAPILDGYETKLEDGYATYHFPKAEHRECRVFVEQRDGEVGCFECPPVSAQFRRRICVKGLKNATVRVFGENYCRDNIDVVLNSKNDYFFVGDDFEGNYVTDGNITYYEARNVTGTLTFSMPQKRKFIMK